MPFLINEERTGPTWLTLNLKHIGNGPRSMGAGADVDADFNFTQRDLDGPNKAAPRSEGPLHFV